MYLRKASVHAISIAFVAIILSINRELQIHVSWNMGNDLYVIYSRNAVVNWRFGMFTISLTIIKVTIQNEETINCFKWFPNMFDITTQVENGTWNMMKFIYYYKNQKYLAKVTYYYLFKKSSYTSYQLRCVYILLNYFYLKGKRN